jgi:hypothetical protein
MAITRQNLVEGLRYIVTSASDDDAIKNITVVSVGNKYVTVRYDDGEVGLWDIDTALYCWSLPRLKPQLPEWLNHVWANVYDESINDYRAVVVYWSAEEADRYAEEDRVGRLCLGTGRWVPCDGEQVLR